jgi:DNA repair protein RecN (Recombination protein N)
VDGRLDGRVELAGPAEVLAVIEELHIRGLGVIEEASLALAPGLTVVTGETGAGKTMLVTALQLLLGMRADTSLVRSGATAALAEAAISPPPPEADAWVDDPDDVLVVTREIPEDGRSRARIGGRLVPVSALHEVLGRHVEVHAQHEHVRLARTEVQRALLDRYAGDPHARVLDRYGGAFERWRELEDARTNRDRDARERARELDRLRVEVAEIDAAELDAEVDATIGQELERLAHADELQQTAAEASLLLGADGAGDPVGRALDALRRLSLDDAELDGLRSRATAVSVELTELAADLRTFGESVEADPERLQRLQERQRLLGQLARKYGARIEDVLAYADDARTRVAQLEAMDEDAADLEQRCAAALQEVHDLAEDLRRGRRTAAERLAKDVDQHLVDLGMPHATFQTAVDAVEDGSFRQHGADDVTFLLAPNPGEPARPLGSAASGGERSRVSLAIEVALADIDDAQVLVFDEVDAGIGGATAMAVGEKLARLAAGDGQRRRQVLCVTHLAQIAAFADVHHVVEKQVRDGRTVTTLRRVGDAARAEELARMMSGRGDRHVALEHARQLLDEAGARAAP